MQGLVTVFGGTGFVGRYAVRALARDGWRVRVAIRQPNLAPELRVMGDVGQIELTQANVRVPSSVEQALDGAAACVNLVGGGLYQRGPQTFEALLAAAPRAMAEACVRQGVGRLVHVSAIGADADSASKYARAKARGETAVRAAVPAATVVRPSIVFGPEDDFFNRFAGMAAMAPALPLIGGGGTRFQPVYAGDVGAAIAAALADPAAAGRTYELGGPGVYSFRQLMEVVLKETCRKRPLVPVPFGIAKLLGVAGDMAGVLPIAPPITSDQVELLKRDNVAEHGLPGLAELGVSPTPLEAVLPTYLWAFRKGGQFAQPQTGAV
ncbi:MAG TPA: complex I NDUFA9 subunit family protein [Caulobacteraceae bacterium]|jgi:NADH dehydrogenase|nr:complex I NDUFA9 subunit family protein [Caulobacteraceae bacterium]